MVPHFFSAGAVRLERGLFQSVAILFLASACSAPPVSSEAASRGFAAEDEAQIRALADRFAENMVTSGCGANSELMTDDFVAMAPSAVGSKADYKNGCETSGNRFTASTQEIQKIQGAGDLAYAWNRFSNTLVTREGERRTSTGNALWALRRGEDGNWRIAAWGAADSLVTLGTRP